MKRTILFLLIFMLAFVAQSQDTKLIKQYYLDAENHLLYEEFELALPLYLKLIDEGWENANVQFSIGTCYLNSFGQWKQAIPYFEKAVLNTSANYREGNYKEEKAPIEAWFYLAKAYRLNNDFEKATEAYIKYKSLLPVSDVYFHSFLELQVKTCETAREMMKNPINFKKTESEFTEDGETYFPAMSGDGNSVAFTSYQEVRDDYGDKVFLELIFYSTKDGPIWKKPKDITDQLYSDGFLSTCHLSYNGDYLLLYRNDYGNGNIYYSELEGRRWTKFEKLGKQISSRDNETHASISKDGTTLYFVSDRPGGIGNKDIYKSIKDNKGRWGTPVNLGDIINTPFEEETPFLSDDEKTLYFASEAHASMGGYDIFKSTLNESGEWSEPQNLGYPINTSGDDLFYLPIGDGTSAYMAKYPPEGGAKKMYKIEYLATERVVEVIAQQPAETVPVIGENNNSNTENADTQVTPVVPAVVVKTIMVPTEYELKGSLTLQDNKELDPSFYVHVIKGDGEVIAALSPNVATGEFKTKIKSGSYTVKAFGDGYEPAQKNIFIGDDQQSDKVLTFLEMVPIEVSSGEYFVIKSILFNYNSSTLSRDAQIEIEKLYALMDKNPSLYVEVIGHSDAHGTDEYNNKLSTFRARQVADYIRNKGIDNSRFVTKGLGKAQFIAINKNPDGSDNPQGRKLNRRVDIKIIRSNSDKITTENIYVPDELRYKDQLTFTILLVNSDKVLEPSYFGQSGDNISNVWMFSTETGYLYTVGRYSHKAEALELMNMVVDAGFPDAKIINSLEYSELIQKSSNFFKSKMNEQDKGVYTIQLVALKKERSLGSFKGLNDVDVILGDDGYYRYIYGEFIGKTSARQALEDVVAKGYYDAFVVGMDKLRK